LNNEGQTEVPITAQSGVTVIAAGRFFTLALKNDGSVGGWGQSDSGGTWLPAGLPPIFAIAAGDFTVALVRDPPPSLALLRDADQTVSLSWTARTDRELDRAELAAGPQPGQSADPRHDWCDEVFPGEG
jgi:hypothetical protein